MTVGELIAELEKATTEQRNQRIGYRSSGRFLWIGSVLYDLPNDQPGEEGLPPVTELSA